MWLFPCFFRFPLFVFPFHQQLLPFLSFGCVFPFIFSPLLFNLKYFLFLNRNSSLSFPFLFFFHSSMIPSLWIPLFFSFQHFYVIFALSPLLFVKFSFTFSAHTLLLFKFHPLLKKSISFLLYSSHVSFFIHSLLHIHGLQIFYFCFCFFSTVLFVLAGRGGML